MFIILYLDVGGVGEVIIVVCVLFYGELNYLYWVYDEVFGVLGVDFLLRYFYR